MSDLQQRIAAYYDAVTEGSFLGSWSGSTLALHFGLADADTPSHEHSLDETNRWLADSGQVGAGTRVLDAGCGVGGSSIYLARERGAEVVGVTLAPGQLALGVRFARERGLEDRVRFALADYADTGFAAASFDVVWNLESLCHAPDLDRYFRHAHQLLAPGGRFVCLDLFRGPAGDPAHAQAMCDGWVLPALPTLEQAAEALRRAGFAAVESVDMSIRVRRSALTLQQLARSISPPVNPLVRGHLDGSLGAAAGLLDGAVTYGHLRAVRP